MKKVISLAFGLLIGLAVWAQGTADTSASAKDSVFYFCWPVNGIDLFWTDYIGYITTSE